MPGGVFLNRILTLVGLLFCFLLFPGILLVTAFEHLLNVRTEQRRVKATVRLERLLDRIDPYKSDEFFFHELLKRAWEDAASAPDPIRRLAVIRSRLHKRFPTGMRFVVWDGKGRLQEHLTDFKGMRYVLSKIWAPLLALTKAGLRDSNFNPLEIPEFVNHFKLVRSFLGNSLVPWHLRLPFLPNPHGSVILTNFRIDRSHCWYRVDDRLGLLVFLHMDLLQQHHGLRCITAAMNARLSASEGIGFTFIEKSGHTKLIKSIRRVITRRNFPYLKEIELALAAFENTSEPFQETSNLLVAIRPLEAGRYAFTWILRNRVFLDTTLAHKRLFLSLTLLALPFLWASWKTFYCGGMPYLSIRWQLVGAFVYANGLPLLVLGFIAYDYLQNQWTTWRDQVKLQATQLLRACDAQFKYLPEQISEQLNAKFASIKAHEQTSPLSTDFRHVLSKTLCEFSPTEFYLVSSHSKIVMSHLTEGLTGPNYPTTHIRLAGQDFLRFFNGNPPNSEDFSHKYATHGIKTDIGNMLNSGLNLYGKVHRMSFGSDPKWCFWHAIGPIERGMADYILFVFWSEVRLQELYLKHLLDRTDGKIEGFQLAARLADGRLLCSNDRLWLQHSWRVFPTSGEPVKDIFEVLDASGTSWVGTGFRCLEMPQVGLAAFLPKRHLEQKAAILKRNLLLFVAASLLLTILTGSMLSQQFLLPLSWLATAVRHIAARKFYFRLPKFGHDELGQLAESLNHTLISLEELDLGRIVQSSLLPNCWLRLAGFICYGQSETMTDLGGDIFDYFIPSENSCGVLIGDVAGHGVPAALMMAFAKAGVALAKDYWADPKLLLVEMNKLFLANKGYNTTTLPQHKHSANPKKSMMHRPMTMLCAVGDRHTSKVKLASAGHCFPILLRASDRSAHYLEIAGVPIGILRNIQVGTLELELRPGDRLVFYTDGFAEARNSKGEAFGFNRLLETVEQAWDADLQKMAANIWSIHRNWTEIAYDDLTLLLMEREKIS